MVKDLISVIVPVYNAEKTLEKCIESILNQTYKKIELLLIDDGSTDASLKTCQSYSDRLENVTTIHKNNGGQSSARNLGIEKSKGEYIGFVDSDDYIAENMYEKLMNAIKENNADLSLCSYYYMNNDGTEYINSYTISPIIYEKLDNIGLLEKLNQENWHFFVTPVNRLYKRVLFNNLLFPEGMKYEDQYLTHHLFYKVHSAVCIPDKLYYYVQTPNSTTRSEMSMTGLDDLYALFDRIRFYRENNIEYLIPGVVSILVDRYMYIRFLIKPLNKNQIKTLRGVDKIIKKETYAYSVSLPLKRKIKLMFPFTSSFMTRLLRKKQL